MLNTNNMYGKGAVNGGLNARRGTIVDSEVRKDVVDVNLSDMARPPVAKSRSYQVFLGIII